MRCCSRHVLTACIEQAFLAASRRFCRIVVVSGWSGSRITPWGSDDPSIIHITGRGNPALQTIRQLNGMLPYFRSGSG